MLNYSNNTSDSFFKINLYCRGCNSSNINDLLSFGEKPIVHHLKKNSNNDDILYDFSLLFCNDCGLVQIKKPINPDILYKNYYTFSSWKDQSHCNNLISTLQKISNINFGSEILEIGSNDGSFITLLNSHGYKKTIGYEPTIDCFLEAEKNNITLINDFFSSETLFKLNNKKFDFIITRHVLEHIIDIKDFLQCVNIVLKDDGILIIEVPDSLMNFHYLDYALWEEHVNYFTLNSIRNILNNYDFHIIHFDLTLYSGRSMILYCKKRNNKNKYNNFTDSFVVENYKNNFLVLKERLNNNLCDIKNLYIYGCGNRSCNFVNFFELTNVLFFVDDQIEKQNLFVPGCNIEIINYNDVKFSGFYLLGVNSENENKILEKIKSNNSGFFSILPPSRLLPNFWLDLIN